MNFLGGLKIQTEHFISPLIDHYFPIINFDIYFLCVLSIQSISV